MSKCKMTMILSILMCFSIFTNIIFAETINDDSLIEIKNVITFDDPNNYLFEISAFNSENQPLKDGYAYVYSYLENKMVGQIKLDNQGKAKFKYQPSKDLILQELKNKEILDVQYAIFITDGKETSLEGFTQTYYSTNAVRNKLNKIKDSIVTDGKRNFKVKTQKPQDDQGLNVYQSTSDENLTSASSFSTMGVIESRDLGSKQTDFVIANAAVGCIVGASIEKGTKTTISGSNVISASFTASSSMRVSQETPAATSPFRHEFYTYYNYVEEKHRYVHGGYVYEYYRIRANQWNGGIGYYSYYESKNAVSPDSISYIATYGPNSKVELQGGEVFTIGAAANLTGPLSGSSYEIKLDHEVYSTRGVYRQHGNTTYYEYGSGKPIVSRYITRY